MKPLGPLPTVDTDHVLQEESIRALRAALPAAEYIFRDERVDDYGVDGSIEVVVDRRATNLRAQVQLKGRSNTSPKGNGAVSVQVNVANLNYLLNGPCPLYVLYRPEISELRFALARDEWARIERENPAWRKQQYITIEFHRVLTSDSLRELRGLIAAEAEVRRDVDQRLNALRAVAGHIVTVNADNLSVTDSNEIVQSLAQLGQMLTNSGLAKVVVERARLVPTRALLESPRAALAVAHAHYRLARYYDAAADIRRLLLTQPRLEPDDRSLLDLLHISVSRMLGEFDEAQYIRQMDEWATSAPAQLAAQYEISRAWSNYTKRLRTLCAGSNAEHEPAHAHVRACLERARSLPGDPLRDSVEFYELTLHQFEISDAQIQANALASVAEIGIGDAHTARVASRAVADDRSTWWRAVENLANRTRTGALPIYCDILLLRDHAALDRERPKLYRALMRGERVPSIATHLIAAAREALQTVRALEDIDLELTAMLSLATALDACGEDAEATTIARDALRTAEIGGYGWHVHRINEFLEGSDRTRARVHKLLQLRESSEEDIIRSAGDDQLQFMATTLAAAHQIPMARAQNILHSLACQRQLARERHDWCKHIVLAEYRANRESRLTLYAERRLHKVVCMKLRVDELALSGDPDAISYEFRQKHCSGCLHRSPGGSPPAAHRKNHEEEARVQRNKAKAARRRRRLGSL